MHTRCTRAESRLHLPAPASPPHLAQRRGKMGDCALGEQPPWHTLYVTPYQQQPMPNACPGAPSPALQVSPPQEDVQGDSWWTRYQPASYKIHSRPVRTPEWEWEWEISYGSVGAALGGGCGPWTLEGCRTPLILIARVRQDPGMTA